MTKKTEVSSKEFDKFHQIEVEKVFDAILSIQNSRIQLGTFFGTVNLTALSAAFSIQKAGIFFFAAALLWLFMILDNAGLAALLGFYSRSLQLKDRFAPNDNDNFLNIILLGLYRKHILRIRSIDEREKRMRAFRTLPIKVPSVYGFWIPLLASLIEVAIGLITWLVFGWEVF
jgi:hypothetical protein